MLPSVFKTEEAWENRVWRVRFPCASATCYPAPFSCETSLCYPCSVRHLIDDYFPTLRAHFPELQKSDFVTCSTRGWDSVVLEQTQLAQTPHIFRLARRAETGRNYPLENIVLQHLRNHTALEVPTFLFVWPGNHQHPQPFVRYKKLPGKPVGPTPTLALATQLGQALADLHQVSLPQGVTQQPTQLKNAWEQTRRRLRQDLGAAIYDQLSGRIADLPDTHQTLLHGDLTADNILVDSSGNLSGLIDFADWAIGDPTYDFRTLCADFDREFTQTCLSAYGQPIDLQHLQLYADLLPLEYAAYYAASGEHEPYQKQLSVLKKTLINQ